MKESSTLPSFSFIDISNINIPAYTSAVRGFLINFKSRSLRASHSRDRRKHSQTGLSPFLLIFPCPSNADVCRYINIPAYISAVRGFLIKKTALNKYCSGRNIPRYHLNYRPKKPVTHLYCLSHRYGSPNNISPYGIHWAIAARGIQQNHVKRYTFRSLLLKCYSYKFTLRSSHCPPLTGNDNL